MGNGSHPIVQLAKAAVAEYLLSGTLLQPLMGKLPAELGEKGATFVSLKKGGRLRGCMGTFQPVTPTIAQEVVYNAVNAATRDPRFSPVTLRELEEIRFSVDVLTPPEPVDSTAFLNPRRYGVLVEQGLQRGLLLPDLEGVDTVEHQLEIAQQKAGIEPAHGVGDPIKIFRFEVRRYQQT
ncbi:MAG: AmmeMemoRadiSam system protein A [Nitrospirae bacterium]|nr:AmmeMemoRadiSam system protein A [Nitrospirota bacterium]